MVISLILLIMIQCNCYWYVQTIVTIPFFTCLIMRHKHQVYI